MIAGFRRRPILGGAALLALVAGMVIWVSEHPRASTNGNYEFPGVSVAVEAPGSARVTYTVRWDSSTFPGVHECTTTVFDASGAIIGQNKAPMISLQPSADASLPVPVSGEPVSAEMSCDQARLDQGPYEYTFSNVRVESSTTDATDAFSIIFDASWAGSGIPGNVRCNVKVYSKALNQLFSTPMDFVIMSGTASDLRIDVAWDDLPGEVSPSELLGASVKFEDCGA